MATWAIRPITPVRQKGDEEFVTYPLASGQDFSKGAPAVLQTDGTVQEAGADPSAILGFFTSDAAGYDWRDDTFGHANPAVPVALADQVFRGTLEGTYDAAADIGDEFGLVEDATGYWTVDRTDTANARVVIVDVDDDVEDGDVNVPVTFRVLAANRQVTG